MSQKFPACLRSLLFITLFALISAPVCAASIDNRDLMLRYFEEARKGIDLSGEWKCCIEEKAGDGEAQQWFNDVPWRYRVLLPGTLDENGAGLPDEEKSDQHLGKPLKFEGAAWYEKTVDVPEWWKERHVELTLERTKVTKVWINGKYVGSNDLVFVKQVFDVTKFIEPGKHNKIVICVNNDEKLVPVAGSHAYSADTQTNWNGIIGYMYLEVTDPLHITSLRITPDVAARKFKVDVTFSQAIKPEDGIEISFMPYSWFDAAYWEPNEVTSSGKKQDSDEEKDACADSVKLTRTGIGSLNAGQVFETYCDAPADSDPIWSDVYPSRSIIYVSLDDRKYAKYDSLHIHTGLREFKSTPDGFAINGHKTFLRGKHDACVFPMTGHPPMDFDSWVRYFSVYKEYGLNHMRCHTWTPPEAAFEAADKVGIYIECELPMWWAIDFKDPKQVDYMQRLGKAILDNYGNHPSFVMMALGNEITKDREDMKKLVDYLRAYDPRPLYAQGQNNRNWDPSYAEGDDYWASFRTGPWMADGSTDARLSMSFLDSKGEGGLLNIRYPSTTINFDKALERSPVPFFGYEVGQYQVFPNFTEIPKYTGVLKPYNLEMYRNRLAKAGMLDQAQDFFLASGALSAICYRADVEAMLRTRRMSGFNLLDLQDYPGQGTALVGMLDAFMDGKGLIRPDEWRQFCAETVILLEQEKYCWTDAEKYRATVDLSNFSARDFKNAVISWRLERDGKALAEGRVAIDSPAYSGLVKSTGAIEFDIGYVVKDIPARCDLFLTIAGTDVKTSYPIWIFSASMDVAIPANVTVADSLDDAAVKALNESGRVLLFPYNLIDIHLTTFSFDCGFINDSGRALIIVR